MSDLDTAAGPGTGLTPVRIAAIAAMLADREAEEVAAGEDAFSFAVPEGTLSPQISDTALRLIVDYETGGRPYYERVMKSRPVWPEASSGVTIGFGYDLGYVTAQQFRADWAGLLRALPPRDCAALEGCLGLHSGKDAAATMRGALSRVRHLTVPWDMADAVFRAATLPRFMAMTRRALPQAEGLAPDCFGVLVSLTFNRGASYDRAHDPRKDPKDRYREMRAIKAALAEGRPDRVPGLIRAMVRLWEGTSVEEGLRRRRTDEAALFEGGLARTGAAGKAEGFPDATPSPASAHFAAQSPDDEANWVDVTEDDLAAAPEGVAAGIQGKRARWAADAESPDYAHLGGNLAIGAAFPLDAADLDLLARLNDFDLSEAGTTPILFGLRGCAILRGHGTADGILLRDQRPDHIVPRCVIGAWDRAGGRVSVFPGSTVPNQRAVARYRQDRSAGNLLATGLYRYVCGTHSTQNGSTPGCLLLRKPDMSKRVVIVRRSADDLCYTRRDLVDPCAPGDNIHPTFFSDASGFSSFGCQTVTGTFRGGAHTGPWAAFRKAAGFTDNDGEPGKPFLYMLLTGAEARLAAEWRLDRMNWDPQALRRLRRLRPGSSGVAVETLQRRLGLSGPDGQMGPTSAAALHRFQAERVAGGGSDGIYGPALDEALGWGVFAPGV